MPGRKLTLRREALNEFTGDELRAVVAADGSGLTCMLATCRISDIAISLCGCLTDYCSIDVC